jgi:glycosyltransferase involved in cell wall biosynthesis
LQIWFAQKDQHSYYLVITIDFSVSVIIPVYNAEKFIAKAVESALQFAEVKEVLLIEDASPDHALDVCRQLADQHPRVKLLQHPDKGNHGAGASRNLGLKNATCPYIAFLDADDFYLPNRFEADQRVFSGNPKADGVYNAIGAHYYSEEAKNKFDKVFSSEITTVTKVVEPDQLFPSFIELQMFIGYFHLDGLTLKKEVLSKMDYWFNEELRLHQDSEFIVRLCYYSNLYPGEIEHPVAMRGVHKDNRILNVQSNKGCRLKHQNQYWVALFKWAIKEEISEKYRKHFERMIISIDIINHSFIISAYEFVKHSLLDKRILLKSVYYDPIHFHLFGNNSFARFLLKLKSKTQYILIWFRHRN